jgi:hypothetical protein
MRGGGGKTWILWLKILPLFYYLPNEKRSTGVRKQSTMRRALQRLARFLVAAQPVSSLALDPAVIHAATTLAFFESFDSALLASAMRAYLKCNLTFVLRAN